MINDPLDRQLLIVFLCSGLQDKLIRHQRLGRCLGTTKDNPSKLLAMDCDSSNRMQQWDMSSELKWIPRSEDT